MAWTKRDWDAMEKQKFIDRRSTKLNDLDAAATALIALHQKPARVKKGKRSKTSLPKPNKKFAPSPNSKKSFYASWEWKTVRLQALDRDGRRCLSCGSTPDKGARLVVDHVKPLGKFWHLRLELSNLQVLCDDCNRGKGDWSHADYRLEHEPEDPLTAEYREIMREDHAERPSWTVGDEDVT